MASTMRGVKVDRDDPLELHEQVAGEIRRAIADGEAKPGAPPRRAHTGLRTRRTEQHHPAARVTLPDAGPRHCLRARRSHPASTSTFGPCVSSNRSSTPEATSRSRASFASSRLEYSR